MTDDTNLRYEETPVIDPNSGEVNQQEEVAETPEGLRSPIPEAARVFGSTQQTPSETSQEHHEVPTSPPLPLNLPPKHGKKSHVGTVLFVLLLFGLGIWLSGQLRSFFSPAISEDIVVPTGVAIPTLRPTLALISSPSATPSTWQTYDVISGSTKKSVTGISYQLSPQVKAPTCDSASCASSGTNLPGGTRFTVAVRGRGQLLPDFRGAILTDATGKEFDMEQTIVGGRSVYEYRGEFTGRTGGGYTFTHIRGVLIPISDTLAIEFNHFSPAGITTDFAGDDEFFEKVIQSFVATGYSVTTPTVQPTVSIPTSTPATSSGF